MNSGYHVPVMLRECITALAIKPEGTYVDVTFGGGGHAKEIMKHLGDGGKLFAFDQDPDALRNAIDDERFVLIHQNFRFLKNSLRLHNVDFPRASRPSWICGWIARDQWMLSKS